MSVYTIMMIAFALACIGWRNLQGGQIWPLVAFCVPFFSLPGLTDVLYFPVERNSPIIGGTLAFVFGALLASYAASQSDKVVLSVGLGAMMLWGAARSFGGIAVGQHAYGLEVVFYLSLLTATALTVQTVGLGDVIKKVMGAWRLGG